MAKIVMLGAGSTVFTKNIIGDIMLKPSLSDCHIALYDIDTKRLKESAVILQTLNKSINHSRAKITTHLGKKSRKSAFKNADYFINAVQIGGYESTLIDFEIPKKYGLRQTIADTVGIGGIFRALRTAPVLLDFAKDIEFLCPDALFINYCNPMAILTGVMLKATDVKTVGLCHSVQTCVPRLLKGLKMKSLKKISWNIAGINHMSWLLEISADGKDIYPEIKKRAAKMNQQARKPGGKKHDNMVRFELMRNFGYYVTESSEHSAEYSPYWIKNQFPELVEEFNIPLDAYLRRLSDNSKSWDREYSELLKKTKISHKRSDEYRSFIIEAMETGKVQSFHGNILNTGLITNLPSDAIVEVPCLVDRSGIKGCFVGDLPQQCAALNRTNINVQLLTTEAILTGKKDYIYQAAMLDPHTASELTIDKIHSMCDDLIEAHGDMIDKFK